MKVYVFSIQKEGEFFNIEELRNNFGEVMSPNETEDDCNVIDEEDSIEQDKENRNLHYILKVSSFKKLQNIMTNNSFRHNFL